MFFFLVQNEMTLRNWRERRISLSIFLDRSRYDEKKNARAQGKKERTTTNCVMFVTGQSN